MTSRAFSTGARRMKKLNWKFKGTTEDVTWLTESVDNTVDQVPGLQIIEGAQINGNPHPTPSRDDPYHGSVELYNKDGQRVTSAHVYPNGYVKFSKENKYPPYKGAPHPKAPVFPPVGPAASKSVSKRNEAGSESDKK